MRPSILQEWAVYKYAWLETADNPRVVGIEIRLVGDRRYSNSGRYKNTLGLRPPIFQELAVSEYAWLEIADITIVGGI